MLLGFEDLMQSLFAFLMLFLVTRKAFKSYLDIYFYVLIFRFFFMYLVMAQNQGKYIF